MKVVIVGGVAGGASAAARLRRLDEKAEILVFERSGHVSYANCGLPYYIGGVITDQKSLTLQTPESFWNRFRIRVKVRHEVVAIHPQEHVVQVRDLVTGREFTETYDKLVLSPGAKPTLPPRPGIDDPRIFTLRTVEDTLRIHEFINNGGLSFSDAPEAVNPAAASQASVAGTAEQDASTTQSRPMRAVLVGGGFIGVEMAENLRNLGLEVTLVQRPMQLLNTLDYDMATLVHAKMREKGVGLKLGSSVEGFRSVPAAAGAPAAVGMSAAAGAPAAESAGQLQVLLRDEAPLAADLVVMAIGVTPDTALAKDAGLELGIRGSILVNDHMETSDPDIYAVGDAVQVTHQVTGGQTLISLAGPANKQGRIAADNICGIGSRYKGSLGSSVVKVFDLTVASVGLTMRAAQEAGINCDRVVLSPGSHAGYYPGAQVMTMKVVFEQGTLRLLGAQIVGAQGVDKRIDVLACAIQAGMRADELKDLDLAYAPPYSSAKDPVNMAGFMVDNIRAGLVKQWHWDQEPGLARDGSVTLLDTRTEGEYRRGHIDGFVNIPVDELRARIGEIDPAKPVYVICQSGLRSYIATRILAQEGFDCYNFSGGYRFFAAVAQDRGARSEDAAGDGRATEDGRATGTGHFDMGSQPVSPPRVAGQAYPCGMEK